MHHASLDRYAGGDSPVHRLDPRAKLIAALVFTAAAVSEPRTELAGLLPYLVPPLAALLASGVPAGFLVRRVLIASPFALVMAAGNPLFETAPTLVVLGPWTAVLGRGWITGGVILLKFLVSVLALLALVTTTRIGKLAGAFSALGVPRPLAMQVVFLYRYLFVIVGEVQRRARAAAARRIGPVTLTLGLSAVGASLSGLFSRSLDRSERVGAAMAARGFDGAFVATPGRRARSVDLAFVALALALAAGLRLRALWLPG